MFQIPFETIFPTGAVKVFPTQRRASNFACKHGLLIRRVQPMHPGDLFVMPKYPALVRYFVKALQRSGFWQPWDYDRYIHRYLYW